MYFAIDAGRDSRAHFFYERLSIHKKESCPTIGTPTTQIIFSLITIIVLELSKYIINFEMRTQTSFSKGLGACALATSKKDDEMTTTSASGHPRAVRFNA